MNFDFNIFSFIFFSVALVLIFEGILYAAFPNKMKKIIESFLSYSDEKVRLVGLFFLGIGVVTIYVLSKYML